MLLNETLSRQLRWDACYNTRDLGGCATVNGSITRFGAIVRSDSVCRLTDQGSSELEAYGIRTIVDLRAKDEVEDEPSPFVQHSIVNMYNLALDPAERSISKAVAAHEEMGLPYMAAVNAAYLVTNRDRIAEIVQAIAEAPDGGVLVHCALGRDRTGLISALLLAAANVPAPTIVADYLLSISTNSEAMEATLGHLELAHGGAEAYLLEAGVTPDGIVRLQQRLLAS